jgi:hypothetical protein
MGRSAILTGIFTTAGLVAAVGVMTAPAAAARASGDRGAFAVVAAHLNNPRGLWPAPGGGLYLAEAGSGGGTCVGGGPEGETCLGLTGSFDRVRAGGVKRIVTGLISGSGPGGVAAEGPVSVAAGPDSTFYGQFGLSSHVVPPAGVIPANLHAAALAQLGHLWLAGPSGSARNVSGVGDQDWTWTSTRINLAPHDFPDAVLYSGGHRYVDAGANILAEVKRNGAVKVLAFLRVPAGAQSNRCRRASRAVPTVRCTSGNCWAASTPPDTRASGGLSPGMRRTSGPGA